MQKQKYSEYIVNPDFHDSIVDLIPNLRFFDKDGCSIESKLISSITFEFIKSEYKCSGVLSLYKTKAPQLIIQKQEDYYKDSSNYNELLILTNHINDKRFVIEHSYIKDLKLKDIELIIGGESMIMKQIDAIILSDDLLSDILFLDYIKDVSSPTIRWSCDIETEKTGAEFISSDVINILEFNNGEYITPLSQLRIPAISDKLKYIPKNDIFKLKQTPYIELPGLLCSTLRSEENFIIDVDFKSDTLNKVPYKIINTTYKPNSVKVIDGDFKTKNIVESLSLTTDKRFNKYFSNSTVKSNTPLSFHIGVSSEEAGSYSNTFDLYISIDRIPLKDDIEILESQERLTAQVVHIANIQAYTEVEGYDERYRTFFTNFGLPDPIEYGTIFKDVNPLENVQNPITVNKKSKELFLAYKDIFPYRGTYKALLNAVNFLGYDDLYFREWYKSNDTSYNNKKNTLTYVGLDIKNGLTIEDKLKSVNIDFETYINLVKLNRLSMVYKINTESGETDEFDVPETVEVYDYKNADILAKLYSVREWLEKHIIGVNCQITDLTAEGVYFQRMESVAYHNSITNFDVLNYANLTPVPTSGEYAHTLKDDTLSANINLTLSEYEHTTFDDIAYYRIIDFVKYVIDITPIRIEHSNYVKVTEEPYYKLKDDNGYFNLFSKLSESESLIKPDPYSLKSINTNNIDSSKIKILDLNIDTWDVNNIFQVPFSVPISAPVIFDNITYNLENRTENGAIYNSLYKSDFIEDSAPDLVYKDKEGKSIKINKNFKFNYIGANKDDKTFINSIILDRNELSLLDYRYQNTEFKNLPSFRIKSGKVRELGKNIKDSVLFSITPIVTSTGQLKYSMKSEHYSDDIIRSKDKPVFTLGKEIIYSNDYFVFVPNYSEGKKSKCKFEYRPELESYYFVLENYKLQFNDTLAIYDQTQEKNRDKLDIRERFIKEISKHSKFIIDIYDGTLTAEVSDPLNNNVFLTEELDYVEEKFSEHDDYFYKNLVYKYIKYNVPVFELKTDISSLIKGFNSDIFNLGGVNGEGIRKLFGNNIDDNKILIARKEVKDKVADAKSKLDSKYIDINSYEKTLNAKANSYIDAEVANKINSLIESNVNINKDINIEVNHTGEYKYEAYAYDNYNNIYKAECKQGITVSKKLDNIWVGTQYHKQTGEDKTLELYDILCKSYGIELGDFFDIKDWQNRHNFIIDYFLSDNGDNKYPKFPKLERYNNLGFYDYYSIVLNDKEHNYNNVVQYDIRTYVLDGQFLSFSNITDSAYDVIHMWDEFSAINSHVNVSSEAKKPIDERLGEHTFKFKMSLYNTYNTNLYDVGTRLNCIIFDNYNQQYIGRINNLKVSGFTSTYNTQSKAQNIELTTTVLINDVDELEDFKKLKEFDKNPHIKFYFIRAEQYKVINYVNDYKERNCSVKIKVAKTSKHKFNKGDVIKLRTTRVKSYNVLADDKDVVIAELIPTFSETAYKVIECKDYKYSLKDVEGNDIEFTDSQYQIVVIDGLLDSNLLAKVGYREDIFGFKSKTQKDFEKIKEKKVESPAYIPHIADIYTETDAEGKISDKALNAKNELMHDFLTEAIGSGFYKDGRETPQFIRFKREWFKNKTKQPGKPLYFNRYEPKKDYDGKFIVCIDKRSPDIPDWFTETSNHEGDNDITSMHSFVNKMLDNIDILDLTISLANHRYVAYPFIMNHEFKVNDKIALVLDDPYQIFKYLDGNYSFTSNDFDTETAYRDWRDYKNYYKYNIIYLNTPTLIENNSDYIILKTSENNWRTINKWTIKQNMDTYEYLLYRLRNTALFLNSYIKDAIYDVELESIDEFGNKVNTIKKAFIKSVD